MPLTPSYQGQAPYTDEYSERLNNAEHLQVGIVGMKQVTLLDAVTGLPVTIGSSSATVSTPQNVGGSASSVTLFAANSSRKGIIIFNDSSAILYIYYGNTATTSNFTYRLNPYETLEPKVNYTGLITGIWASATGNARLTELT